MGKKPLFLILKTKWYNQIKDGKKNIEYRDFNTYYFRRLANKKFSYVLFQLGFTLSAPRMIIPIIKIDIGQAIIKDKNDYGQEIKQNIDYFRIHLDTKKIKHLIQSPTSL